MRPEFGEAMRRLFIRTNLHRNWPHLLGKHGLCFKHVSWPGFTKSSSENVLRMQAHPTSEHLSAYPSFHCLVPSHLQAPSPEPPPGVLLVKLERLLGALLLLHTGALASFCPLLRQLVPWVDLVVFPDHHHSLSPNCSPPPTPPHPQIFLSSTAFPQETLNEQPSPLVESSIKAWLELCTHTQWLALA